MRVLSISLTAFFPGASGTVGDPRIVFDPHALRWVAMATNFNTSATIYLAYSATPDALGAWFKFSYQTNLGTDAGKWPDYPTLGVDARGIYSAAYMVSGASSRRHEAQSAEGKPLGIGLRYLTDVGRRRDFVPLPA